MINANLKNLIKQKGLTNYKVAKKAEVGQATVCELVNGNRKEPRLSTAIKISNVLGIDVEEFFNILRRTKKNGI